MLIDDAIIKVNKGKSTHMSQAVDDLGDIANSSMNQVCHIV